MLSILIPVYNYDVRGLVLELINQIKKIEHPVEIQLLNDGSDPQLGLILNELSLLSHVRLHSFTNNQGRIASRRKLAQLAQYDHLLFIDCDAVVVSDNYLMNYLNNIKDSEIIVGGHVYQDSTPEAKYILHWTYGHNKEVRPWSEKLKKPYRSFSTFNFCIPKRIFNKYLIDIEVNGYGHEDTIIGHVLHKNGIAIRHIDNPLLHAGLKEVDQFLEDTNSALQNALLISKDYPNIDIKVIRSVKVLQSFGLKRLMYSFLNLFENKIESNLKSENPRLLYLQLYKLKTYLELTILSAEAKAKEGDN